MRIKLSCKETSRLLSQNSDGKLGFSERLALRIHLRLCDGCTQFSRQLDFLRRAMQEWPGPDSPADNNSTRA